MSIIEHILEQWIHECEIKAVLYKINYNVNKLDITIYTHRPGLMIGYHGTTINKYKNIIKEMSHTTREISINFIETSGCVIDSNNE